jgi:RNA polymerase sigma factor (sigma-70 family)
MTLPDSSLAPHGAKSFPTTCWTMVLHAGNRPSPESSEALVYLCRAYWHPLYAFIRFRGHSAHDAQDLTQAFFAHLLEHQALNTIDRDKGKFRSFLLASLKNFLANEYDKDNAQKRGGGHTLHSLDFASAESRMQIEPSHNLTPEKAFDRQWAITLLDHVLAVLRTEYESAGDAPFFDELKATITGDADTYAEIALRTGRTAGAIKVAAHRLRRRYRDLLRAEIAQTVDAAEIDEELQHLMAAVSTP